MMMKKLCILLPIAAMLLASCSKDEQQSLNPQRPDIPEGAIWFSSGIHDMTRGLTTLSNFTSFNVTGVHNTISDAFSFQNLNVTSAGGTDATWTYTGDPKYFPGDNSNISFYAYSPTDLQSQVSITDGVKVITGFTQVTSVAAQKDVLASYATGNKINNTTSGVTLNFKHALAQIEVMAKNSNTAKYKVTVLGAKLCRINKTGTMTFQETVEGYPTWASQSTSENFIKKGSNTSPIELDGTAKNIMFGDDNFLMVPQQLTAWTGISTDESGAYLSVLCRIESNTTGSGWVLRYPDEAGKYGFTAIPISTNWQSGHKYVYTLDFFGEGGGAGLIDPQPTNPEDGGDTDVDPTPNPRDEGGTELPGGGGTAIIPEAKANIKFTVSISDWINGAGDNESLNL